MLLVIVASALAQDRSPGERIDPAVSLKLGVDGIQQLSGLVDGLAPESVEVAPTSDEQGAYCFSYAYELSEMWVDIAIDDLQLSPAQDRLDLTAEMTIAVNDAADPFALYIEALCQGTNCPGYVDPFPVGLSSSVTFEVAEDSLGEPWVDVTVAPFALDNGLASEHIHLDCSLGTLEDVLNIFGLSIYELIIGALEDQLNAQLDDLRVELEAQLEDALSAASLSQELDLAGAVLSLELQPSAVEIDPEGLNLILAGVASAPAQECVVAWDPELSVGTSSALPGAEALGDHDAALVVADDFANQLLYAAWRGGALCQSLGPADGLPLDSGVLDSLTGGVLTDILPEEPAPVFIELRPRLAPVMNLSTDHDAAVDLHELGLDLYTEIDDRMARALPLRLQTRVDIDLDFDPTTGQLETQLGLQDELVIQLPFADLAPGHEEELASSVSAALPTLLDAALGGLLSGLSFGMPGFGGVGVTDMGTSQPSGEWLALQVDLGTPAYEPASCEDGCSGGCSGTGLAGGWLGMLALVLLRRRS